MKRKVQSVVLFVFGLYCSGQVPALEAAECPAGESYAIINYNHQLLNQYVTVDTWSQASGLRGPVGIKISPAGIVNAGNNKLTRTIDLVYTTPDCDCLAETATSQVTVTVTGTCSNGILNMQMHEVYPDSSALVTCTGGDSCPIYTQQYPGSSTSFTLDMAYFNGNTIIRPYACANCSGTYSWNLQFTSTPPPADYIPLAPIAPLLELLLHQANQ